RVGELCVRSLDANDAVFTSSQVLTPPQVSVLQIRTQILNTIISQVAAAHSVPVVDVNTLLRQVDTSFTGGFFSLYGIHPSVTGHLKLANAFIRAIDAEITKRGSFGGFNELLPLIPE